MKPIRTFEVTVRGFPPALYSARTRAKACARAYYSFTAAYECSFRDFLKMASIKLAPNPPEVGKRVMICGKPATTVLGSTHHVAFMRDDSDVIFYSHPNDVLPLADMERYYEGRAG